MKNLFLVGIIALGLSVAACTDEAGAIKTAQHQGLTNVQTQGYAFWGCSKDDTFHTKFTATDVRGQPVSGVVCKAWFKGSSVKFDD